MDKTQTSKLREGRPQGSTVTPVNGRVSKRPVDDVYLKINGDIDAVKNLVTEVIEFYARQELPDGSTESIIDRNIACELKSKLDELTQSNWFVIVGSKYSVSAGIIPSNQFAHFKLGRYNVVLIEAPFKTSGERKEHKRPSNKRKSKTSKSGTQNSQKMEEDENEVESTRRHLNTPRKNTKSSNRSGLKESSKIASNSPKTPSSRLKDSSKNIANSQASKSQSRPNSKARSRPSSKDAQSPNPFTASPKARRDSKTSQPSHKSKTSKESQKKEVSMQEENF